MPGRSLLLAALLLGSLPLGGCTLFGIRSGTQEPAFTLLDRPAPDLEIRRYPARLAAATTVPGGDSSEARNQAFRILAAYIFGANRPGREIAMTVPVTLGQGGERIAMTLPVASEASPDGLVMQFLMPAAYDQASLPEPTDPRVRIVAVPPQEMAALRYSGSAGPGAVAERSAELLQRLQGTRWQAQGEPVALFYDPPWTIPWLRRNEVAVAVAPAGPAG